VSVCEFQEHAGNCALIAAVYMQKQKEIMGQMRLVRRVGDHSHFSMAKSCRTDKAVCMNTTSW